MTSKKYKAVVLLSGGMDSTTCLATALESFPSDHILALSFDYGQRHRDMELQAGKRVADFYRTDRKVVNLSQLQYLLGGSALTQRSIAVPEGHYEAESMKITVVPNRNAIMLSIAFGVARAESAVCVFIGAHSGDHAIYPDCRLEFMAAFDSCMNLANADLPDDSRPTLVAPFIGKSKADIVRDGTAFTPPVPYDLTYSCYKGQQVHCGVCGTCTERKEAFELANVPDPTLYVLNVSEIST